MDKLLFPVKLGRSPCYAWRTRRVWALGKLWVSFCPQPHSRAQLSVVAGTHSVPDVAAVQAVMLGARAELGSGRSPIGDRYPQVVIEVLRVDEQALESPPSSGLQERPLARGTTIGVLGRARLLELQARRRREIQATSGGSSISRRRPTAARRLWSGSKRCGQRRAAGTEPHSAHPGRTGT